MAQKNLSYSGPVQVSIPTGATTPDPGIPGVQVWSTYTNCLLTWNGVYWEISSGSGLPDSRPIEIVNSYTKKLHPSIVFTRSTTKAYFDVDGVMKFAPIDTLPFEYDPVTHECLGVSIWGPRTNAILHSCDLTNAAWAKARSTVDPDTHMAPDGTMTADTLFETVDVGTHQIMSSGMAVTATAPVTASSFLLYAGRAKFRITLTSAGLWPSGQNPTIEFDIVNKTATLVLGTAAGFIDDCGDGWYRCSLIATPTVSGSSNLALLLTDDAGNTTYAGDITKGVVHWGSQLENGTKASPVMLTTTATVTSGAEQALISGSDFTDFYNQSEGTIVSEDTMFNAAPLGTATVAWTVSDGTDTNSMYGGQYVTPTYHRIGTVVVGGVQESIFQDSGYGATTGFLLTAFAYKANDLAGAATGKAIMTDAVSAIPAVDRFHVGRKDTGQWHLGHIKYLAYYPYRVTNLELVNLVNNRNSMIGPSFNQVPTNAMLGDYAYKNTGSAEIPISDVTDLTTTLAGKQATLVAGTNIKYINTKNILGAGELAIYGSRVFTFGGTGVPTIGNDKTNWLATHTFTRCLKIRLIAKTPPSGGSFTVSLNAGDGDSFGTAIGTISLASGTKTNTLDIAVFLPEGTLIRLDISAVNGVADWTCQLETIESIYVGD